VIIVLGLVRRSKVGPGSRRNLTISFWLKRQVHWFLGSGAVAWPGDGKFDRTLSLGRFTCNREILQEKRQIWGLEAQPQLKNALHCRVFSSNSLNAKNSEHFLASKVAIVLERGVFRF